MARRNRRNLPYRIIPTDLKKRRRIAPDYANFYGSYVAKTGIGKRFSFKVPVYDKNPMVLYKLMRHTCNKLKRNLIPDVPNGFIFQDFGHLHVAVDWMRVRKLRFYRAGMHYAR